MLKLDLLIIFVAQVIFVSMTTVRWIILVRGMRWIAAAISVVEMSVQVVALGLVVRQLHDPLNVVAYALGHGVGSLVGSKVEETLAIGYNVFQIITRSPSNLASQLREHGLGVTEWQGEGREGSRQVLMVVARRRLAGELYRLLDRLDPTAFVVRLEPQSFRGGFLGKILAK